MKQQLLSLRTTSIKYLILKIIFIIYGFVFYIDVLLEFFSSRSTLAEKNGSNLLIHQGMSGSNRKFTQRKS
ncbi:hypothetical protein ASG16_024230 [Brevibacillus sp. Leaf182]|nr:hypothetical protein ASG16_024230 [Brevibacillus sp. Leaf182]